MNISRQYKIFLLILFFAISFIQVIIYYKNNSTLIGFASVGRLPVIKKPQLYFINGSEPYRARLILESNEPKIVFMTGTMVFPELKGGKTYIGSNTSLIGVGKTAQIAQSGITISGTDNILIRNIEFKDAPNDAITIENGAHHIWIDHCVFSNAFDGLCDIVTGSDYVTLSWNIFKNHRKTILIGNSNKTESLDKNHLHVTIHHNYFQGTVDRHPRVRFGSVHVYNNYYENNLIGVRSTNNAKVKLENNFFNNVTSPTLVGFDGEYYGKLRAKGDIYMNVKYQPIQSGKVFDPKDYYTYSLNNALFVPIIVKLKAGLL